MLIHNENTPATLATLLIEDKGIEVECGKNTTTCNRAREAQTPPQEFEPPKAITPQRVFAVNDAGYAIGQDHHRATLSDHDVWLIQELLAEGISQRQVAKKFEVSRGTVGDIASGRRRGQAATGQRARLKR